VCMAFLYGKIRSLLLQCIGFTSHVLVADPVIVFSAASGGVPDSNQERQSDAPRVRWSFGKCCLRRLGISLQQTNQNKEGRVDENG
jgi:hypothetical protein